MEQGEGEAVPPPRQAMTETPFVSDPAEAAAFDIPVQYVRRMEEAQRVYGNHYMEQRTHADMWNHAAMTIGIQCCWLGVSAWIVGRGMRYSDPMNSLLARWVQQSRVRRLTTPISCLGLFIFTATCTQLPHDVALLRSASAGVDAQAALMAAATEERQRAFREGKAAKAQVEAMEAERFAASMKAS